MRTLADKREISLLIIQLGSSSRTQARRRKDPSCNHWGTVSAGDALFMNYISNASCYGCWNQSQLLGLAMDVPDGQLMGTRQIIAVQQAAKAPIVQPVTKGILRR